MLKRLFNVYRGFAQAGASRPLALYLTLKWASSRIAA